MAGERSARSASARSRAGTSSRKSTWRRQAETESRSSSGSFIPSSQRRPRRPKRSLGRRGQRLRARADLVLRAACGRAAAAPGGRRAGPAPLSPRPGSTPPRGNPTSSLARVRASRLSVLALARRPIGACGCWHHHASDVRLDHPRDIRRADRRTRAPGPPHPGSARTAQAPAVSSRPSPPSATSPPSAIAPRSGRGGCLPPVKRTCPPLVGDRSKGAADEATRPPTCSQHTRGGGHEQRRPRSHRFEISLPLPASRSAPVPGLDSPGAAGENFLAWTTARRSREALCELYRRWGSPTAAVLPPPSRTVHREPVREAQGALRLAPRVRDPQRGQGGDRRLHRSLRRPTPLGARLPDPRGGPKKLDGAQEPTTIGGRLSRQRREGPGHGVGAASATDQHGNWRLGAPRLRTFVQFSPFLRGLSALTPDL